MAAEHESRRAPAASDTARLGHLRALAAANPTFASAAQAARDGRDEEFTPAEQVIPGWLPGGEAR